MNENDEREMILCIPGPWKTREELILALVTAHGGRYLMAGFILRDTQDDDSLTIEWEPHDPRMARAFQCCGHDENTMAALVAHGSVVYIHFPLDVPEQRERLLKYTDVLRKAGGIAVKLETCGLSHPWDRWFEWLSAPFINNHYRAVVVSVGGAGGWYSCGMHHFGQPDSAVNDARPDAKETLEEFNKYILMESPTLSSGHTFSKDAESPRRRLRWTEDDRFPSDDLFHNPHGLWNLDTIA